MTTDKQWDVVTSVGLTALAVAAGRAIETNGPTPLAEDPHAETLVRHAEPPNPMPTRLEEGAADTELGQMWERTAAYMGIRTRFFDQFFQQAISDGARQAVILASGLDTRPYRLDWPDGFPVFEIDQPEVLAFKFETLKRERATARCEHKPVAVDLRDDWMSALRDAGFDAEQPTAWLAEGLLPYLPAQALEALLGTIDELSAPGSVLAVEEIADIRKALENQQFGNVADVFGIDLGELVYSEEGRIAAGTWLADRGWTISDESVEDTSKRFGRELLDWGEILQDQRYITARRPR